MMTDPIFLECDESLIAAYMVHDTPAVRDALRGVVAAVRDNLPELGPVFVLANVASADIYVIERARLNGAGE